MRVAHASIGDAERIALLIRRSFLVQAELLGITESEFPNYVAFQTQGDVAARLTAGSKTLLGFVGGILVGTVTCELSQTDPHRGELLRLAVLPSHRRNGYGAQLIAHAEDLLSEMGARVAELSIVAQFERLRSYYERLGYAVATTRAVAVLPFNVTHMEKVLDDSYGVAVVPNLTSNPLGTSSGFSTSLRAGQGSG